MQSGVTPLCRRCQNSGRYLLKQECTALTKKITEDLASCAEKNATLQQQLQSADSVNLYLRRLLNKDMPVGQQDIWTRFKRDIRNEDNYLRYDI